MKKKPGGGAAGNPNSLANLKRGNVETLVPGAGPKFEPGASPALKHGLRSRAPSKVVLDPIVREIEASLTDDLPLKNADGSVPAADRFAVELAAIALLRVRRVSAYLELHGDTDAQDNLRPELEGLGKAVDSATRMLRELGCTPRARAALGVDVARMAQAGADPATLLSAAQAESDPALRARLLESAGLINEGDDDA